VAETFVQPQNVADQCLVEKFVLVGVDKGWSGEAVDGREL
jgi:hypothetical protein